MNNGYSVCFNEWALDKSIKDELGLLLIISSLTAEKGYCYASNDYLAELFDTNVFTISRKIKILEEKKYIEIEYDKKGCLVTSRKIRLTKIATTIDEKRNRTIDEKRKENIINNINITNNNIKEENIKEEKPPKEEKIKKEIPYKEIVDYLNFKINTNYKSTTEKTQKVINARFNEGFTLEDFKKVIDIKTKEWLNDKDMCKYLRPETLFGTKFESYLNQKEKEITTKDIAKVIDWSDF